MNVSVTIIFFFRSGKNWLNYTFHSELWDKLAPINPMYINIIPHADKQVLKFCKIYIEKPHCRWNMLLKKSQNLYSKCKNNLKMCNLFKLECVTNKLTALKSNLFSVWPIPYLSAKEVIKEQQKKVTKHNDKR